MKALGSLLVACVVACGFGSRVERPDARTIVENRGANRYVYRSTVLVPEPARGPAAPLVRDSPLSARQVGLVEVNVEYGAWGGGGLRDREADFYPELAVVAGELGGTHFKVLCSTRDSRREAEWISSLTVSVLKAQ
jgi:hypothetical protein